jgi:hypothetical protein
MKKVTQITHVEWNDLVTDTYSRTYDLQQQDDCYSNGSSVSLSIPYKYADDFEQESIPEEVNGRIKGVKFEAWLARDPKQPLKNQESDWKLGLWWGRNFYPNLHVVANDLHKRGLLEAGDYIITIDW